MTVSYEIKSPRVNYLGAVGIICRTHLSSPSIRSLEEAHNPVAYRVLRQRNRRRPVRLMDIAVLL